MKPMLMKKSFIVVLCIAIAIGIAVQSYAQPFEGTITWRVPDPASKAAANLILKAKGTNIAATIKGGMLNGLEVWFMNNDTEVVRVVRPQKMFIVVSQKAMAAAARPVEVSKFVKTSETAKILNYTCTKYTGEMKAQGTITKVAIWTTTDIKDDLKVLAHQPDPLGNPKLPVGVDGIPIKIEKTDASGTAVMEVTEVKLEKLSDDLFKIPSDFKDIGK
jgi:hypothetical protein